MTPQEKIALTLTRGAVALVLTIAIGAFGRSFFLAVVLHEDHPISESATQLLTALGSALVGGAVGYLSGTAPTARRLSHSAPPTQAQAEPQSPNLSPTTAPFPPDDHVTL